MNSNSTSVNHNKYGEPQPLYIDREDNSKPIKGVHLLPLLGLAILAIMFAMALFPKDVAKYMPITKNLYEKIGLINDNSKLHITNVELNTKNKNKKNILIVKGHVENNVGLNVSVPELTIAVRDKNENEIYKWDVLPKKNILNIGETTSFTATIENYDNIIPDHAKDIEIQFNESDLR